MCRLPCALLTSHLAAYADLIFSVARPAFEDGGFQQVSTALQLPRFTIGVGDRFARQASAQLAACIRALDEGVQVSPVWNKSNREHTIIGSDPAQTRAAADTAVQALDWKLSYFLDADHINCSTVDRFLQPCDFFTLDVADHIGKPSASVEVDTFLARHPELIGDVHIPGIDQPFHTDESFVREVANTFLAAVKDAKSIYDYVLAKKGDGCFISEVSMDETERPQTPIELIIILAAIADHGIAIQTIAPKFTGRFNKGVDYIGDLSQFSREFNDDLAAIAFSIATYGLPNNLKLSVHSGSDKFSLYPIIHDAITRAGAGVHLKTAGTTWLEELIGLAEAGGDGLALAKEIYGKALAHADELTRPYATVIDIKPRQLPTSELVNAWSSDQYTRALRHDSSDPAYNPSFRQLLHVGFKVAATMGDRYLQALEAHRSVIATNVTTNLFERHIRPVFLGR